MGELSIVKSEPLPLTLVKSVPEAPQERSFADAVANAGEKFWEWTGKPVALALGMGSGTDSERGTKAREAQKQIVNGILQEPARVRQELTNALDAFVAGNPRATMHHVLTAVPLVGEGINQAAQEFNKGDISSGIGHVGAMMFPAAAAEAPTLLRGAKAVGGAMRDVAGTVLPERVPTPEGAISPAVTHRIGRWVAGKFVPGGGLAYDLVRDLVKGAPDAAPPAVETPGMILARESGADWANLSPIDQAMLETVARAKANVAGQPAARPPMGPPQAAPEPTVTPGPAPRSPLFPDLPPPEAPAAPAPEPAPSSPPAGGRPAAADLAAQLEASMRAETLTDYLVRNKVPAAMLDQFGPEQWDMVSKQAGVKPPTPENIQAIRGNLAQYEGAANQPPEAGKMPPAEAQADFEQRRATRNARKPKATAAPPADVEAQLADSLAAVQKGERPVAPVAEEGPAKPTASEVRVNAFAERLAAEHDIPLENLDTIAQNPEALRYMDNLGRSLGIQGSLAPGEVSQIVDRVRQLRGAEGPPAPTTLRDLMQPEPPAAAAPRARRSKPVR